MPTIEPTVHSPQSETHFACAIRIRKLGKNVTCCDCPPKHDCPNATQAELIIDELTNIASVGEEVKTIKEEQV